MAIGEMLNLNIAIKVRSGWIKILKAAFVFIKWPWHKGGWDLKIIFAHMPLLSTFQIMHNGRQFNVLLKKGLEV